VCTPPYAAYYIYIKRKRTPIFFAIDGSHDDAVLTLLERKPSLDVLDDDGNTLLHIAALRGSIVAIEKLLDAGLSMTAINHVNKPIITIIIVKFNFKKRDNLLLLLLLGFLFQERYILVNLSFTIDHVVTHMYNHNHQQHHHHHQEGFSPAYIACDNGKTAAVALFLDRGLDINISHPNVILSKRKA
jgi:ankyrin repeat protein